jgi:RNA polymerase sigma-70 factor (ECF subfamily)
MNTIDKNFSDRIIGGDRKAFDELFRMFYSRLLGFAKSYLKDEAVAENIVQDAFLLLWERRDTLRPDSNIQAWLLTVVKNNTINHINRLKRQAQVENTFANRTTRELDLRIASLTACDPEYMFGSEVEQIIQKALNSLPEQCRKVITMSRFGDMSNKEIAEKLDITVKGVEYHITNALRKLRAELKDYLMFLLFFA